ncbi:hypothetical protein COU78_04965 [Candidatus Peregrinibacteria bacterium CG10_big_fil_rev_8_21_14_0_10_49_24]|nr:MAG: hypothetical protein COU78_04965 [Candidatus Peregrinibacteria bacterium CG10_big_fil_rev_8_21_14_0_10_49_24]
MSVALDQRKSSESNSQMSSQGRKKGVSIKAIQERKNHILKLSSMGFTTRSITRVINSAAEEKQWGCISERQVQRVIAEYYSENRYQNDLEEYGMRQAHIAQLEADAMMLLRHLKTNKQWAPFEYTYTVRECFNALQRIVEVRGYNLSKTKNYKTHPKRFLPPEPPDYSDKPVLKDLMDFFDLQINNQEVA